MAPVRFGRVPQVGRQVQKDEEAFAVVLRQLVCEPGALLGAQRGVHNLRVEHDGADGTGVEAVPRPAEALVVVGEARGGNRMGRHSGIGLVADIVVAGDEARLQSAGLQLG